MVSDKLKYLTDEHISKAIIPIYEPGSEPNNTKGRVEEELVKAGH